MSINVSMINDVRLGEIRSNGESNLNQFIGKSRCEGQD